MMQVIEVPSSKESEMMVLGCMLTSMHALNISCKGLSDIDFYFIEHKIIFKSLQSTWQTNGVGDVHLICEELKRQDKLKSVGGPAYITTLAQYAGTSAYVEEYIQELKNYANKRKILDLSSDLQKKVLSGDEPQKILMSAQQTLRLIERNKGVRDRCPIQFLNQFDENFLLVAPPKKPMLLEYTNDKSVPVGFLPKGVVAMIVGAGGVGKTHLLAHLAISIATGAAWLDRFIPTDHCGDGKKGSVFLGLGENQYEDIHRVLYKASKLLRKHQPDLLKSDPLVEVSKRIAVFSFCGQQAAFIEDKRPSLYFQQLKMKLIEIAPPNGWSLLIFDPISRLMGADAETDNAVATQFVALMEELAIELPGNPTILLAHHINKAALQQGANQTQGASRGASALTDGVRWQVNLTHSSLDKDRNNVILKMTKSNFTAILPEMELQKDADGCFAFQNGTETKNLF